MEKKSKSKIDDWSDFTTRDAALDELKITPYFDLCLNCKKYLPVEQIMNHKCEK